MPAFSYLVPILVLFGLGPVVGVVATAIYAIPPIVRNTILGLDRVSEEIVESGRMSGSSRFQLLWWIRIPVSVPTLLVGVNQTIMAGLSMVVITAILGGFPDIGLEVINSMKKARFGESILAAFVIVLMAMLLDRISGGFVARQINPRLRRHNPELRRRVLHGFGLTFLAILAAYLLWPSIGLYPETLVFFPAEQLNNAIGWFTRYFYDYTQAVKDAAFFFLLLPLKEGMKESVRPHVWGFTLSEFTTSVYVVLVFVGAVTATVLGNWRLGVGVAALGLLYFFGTLGIPWLAIVLLVVVPAWQIGGGNVALLALVGLLFIAITGLWDRAMVSVQLCGAGVLVSFLIGSTLGVIAALSDQFSKIIRPINDTLQTMPIFVFLIPSVMVFLVGEFTALVSIVLYATVPSIRYTEHGIRNVPSNVVEAAGMCGASRLQVLRDVQLPMALPEMMLGLNQTIMMGLAMVVVATLVGAKGLGQEIMVALTWADVGRGLVAGLAIAFIAMITDRVFQAWSFRKKQELGFS
jgi:glycine betaine/proline transport system permease protein